LHKAKFLFRTDSGELPPANPDLPEEIGRLYDEARSIARLSPRGAAALLRLAVQRLCKELGEPGENLNDDIGSLAAKGRITPDAKRAFDLVRFTGNQAVHAGEIDLADNPATTKPLFYLINLIANDTISQKKLLDALYQVLPEGVLQQIAERDRKAAERQAQSQSS
jgi:hypothetical protein